MIMYSGQVTARVIRLQDGEIVSDTKEVFTKMKPVSIKYILIESLNNIEPEQGVVYNPSLRCVTILLMGCGNTYECIL